MIDTDRGCSEILTQIAAVRAALDKVGKILLEDHLESCMVESVKSGNHEEFLGDLKEALRFTGKQNIRCHERVSPISCPGHTSF